MPTARSKQKIKHDSVPRIHILQVMRFRGALDWLLALPRWEDAFALSASELELPGKRQGISRTAALRSLRIEHKFSLLKHALAGGLETPSHREALALARKLGITAYQSRPDFERPSSKDWQRLAKLVQTRLSSLYSSYKDAQGELYNHFQRLPESLAHEVCSNLGLLDDAKQEARLALLDAIDHISDQGCFESYARQWIKRRIQNTMMRSKLPVSAPINLISKTLRQMDGANAVLAKALRDGTVVLDNTASEDTLAPCSSIERYPDPAEEAESFDIRLNIQLALHSLTDKQREVVALRFGFDPGGSSLSLSEIAMRTGISRQQVHQREKRALQKLAAILREPARELQYRELLLNEG